MPRQVHRSRSASAASTATASGLSARYPAGRDALCRTVVHGRAVVSVSARTAEEDPWLQHGGQHAAREDLRHERLRAEQFRLPALRIADLSETVRVVVE